MHTEFIGAVQYWKLALKIKPWQLIHLEKNRAVFILCNHCSILGEHFQMFLLVVLSAAPQTYLGSKHR